MSNHVAKHLKLAYQLISITLFLPIIISPMAIFFFNSPLLLDQLIPSWMLYIAMLLIVSASMDSMLYGITSFRQSVDAALWVSLFSIISISTLQNHGSAWSFAVLFLLHSLRSGTRLFKAQPNKDWWLWFAWSRDIIAALSILFWLHSFQTV